MKSSLGGLFDFSFQEFVTTKIIRILYGLAVLVIVGFTVVMTLGALATMFSESFLGGLGMLIAAPLLGLLYLLLARVWIELIIVLFRIAENTTELVRMKGAETGRAASGPSPAGPSSPVPPSP